jgi:hypothetical protein
MIGLRQVAERVSRTPFDGGDHVIHGAGQAVGLVSRNSTAALPMYA